MHMQTVARPRLRDDIATELTRLIANGELPAVERLKEVELANKLGVSRTPLREALLVLERDGLVISEVNKGFRVADLSETRVRELFPVIAALEAEALRAGGEATRALGPELLAINGELRKLVRSAKASKAKLEGFLRWTDTPLVKFAEWGLVLLLAAHLTGGLRLLALEFLPWRDWQKTLAAIAGGLALVAGLVFALAL